MMMMMSIKAWRHDANSFHAHVQQDPAGANHGPGSPDQGRSAVSGARFTANTDSARQRGKGEPLCPTSRPKGAGLLGFTTGRSATCTESANVFDAGFAAASYRAGLHRTPASQCPESPCRLNDLFLAILLASNRLSVRLRPELKASTKGWVEASRMQARGALLSPLQQPQGR
jgi:hypothetical protein